MTMEPPLNSNNVLGIPGRSVKYVNALTINKRRPTQT